MKSLLPALSQAIDDVKRFIASSVGLKDSQPGCSANQSLSLAEERKNIMYVYVKHRVIFYYSLIVISLIGVKLENALVDF